MVLKWSHGDAERETTKKCTYITTIIAEILANGKIAPQRHSKSSRNERILLMAKQNYGK